MSSVKKNYIYNTVFQVLKVVLPIITAPYIARVLGAEGNGIYGFTISVVTCFVMIGGLGIDLYGQREIAFVQNDIKKRSQVFRELFILKAITMTIAALIFMCVFGFDASYGLYYRILLIEILASLIDVSWFFQGMENFKKITIRNIIAKLVGVCCVFIFVKSESDIWIYLLIYAATTFIGSVILWPSLLRLIEKTKEIHIARHIKPALAVFLPQIAEKIYTVLDKTMLGWVSADMREVGFYEQAQKIIKILLTVITSLGIVMMPRIANCFARGDFDRIQKYLQKAFRFVLAFALPLMAGVIVAAPRFVPLFFGSGYDKVIEIMQIISPIMLFIGLTSIIGVQYLIPTKRQRDFTISIVLGASVNFVFNLILIPPLGSYGAAIATVIAEFAVLLSQIIMTRKEIDYKNVAKMATKYALYSLIMSLVCLLVDITAPRTTIGLVVMVVSGVISYIVMLIITKDSVSREIFSIINKRKLIK